MCGQGCLGFINVIFNRELKELTHLLNVAIRCLQYTAIILLVCVKLGYAVFNLLCCLQLNFRVKWKKKLVNSLTCPLQAESFCSNTILKLLGFHSTHSLQYPPPISSGSLHTVVFIRFWFETTTHCDTLYVNSLLLYTGY